MMSMKKTNFNELLQRYLNGTASEEEKAKLDAWLDARKEEDTKHMLLSAEEEEILFQKISSKADNVSEIRTLYAQPHDTSVMPEAKHVSMNKRYLSIAASFLILAVASFAIWKYSHDSSTSVYTSAPNEVRKVILEDGTLVWLRGNSSISYYEDKELGTRNSKLDGEALFEVAKDATRPFIITHNQARIKVLGTSFNLNASGDTLEVKVLTGRVLLTSESDKAGIEILPNESAMYTSTHGIEKQVFSSKEVMAITSGTEYNMQFANTSLHEIATRIEEKFNVRMKFENKDAGSCRITADFTDHSLESTLQLMTEVLDIRYTIKDSQVFVSGSCK